jgi:hypothetical protein
MCSPATCRTCGGATYRGCGMHVEQVLAGVPKDRRCRCTGDQRERTGLRRLFSRG